MKAKLEEMLAKLMNKPTFSNTEAVTSFPYTPSHSGILTLLLISSSNSAVWRSARITDQTANKHTDLGCYFSVAFGGISVEIPVIKGHTYVIASGASYIYLADGARSYLTY